MEKHIEAAASDDLLWGIAAIARVINRNQRQSYHLLQTGALPARKIGQQWVASRGQLLATLVGDAASAA
jgi:hypothetical protein